MPINIAAELFANSFARLAEEPGAGRPHFHFELPRETRESDDLGEHELALGTFINLGRFLAASASTFERWAFEWPDALIPTGSHADSSLRVYDYAAVASPLLLAAAHEGIHPLEVLAVAQDWAEAAYQRACDDAQLADATARDVRTASQRSGR